MAQPRGTRSRVISLSARTLPRLVKAAGNHGLLKAFCPALPLAQGRKGGAERYL